MAEPINEITIQGFKSIRDLDRLRLRSLNVLIGANGAGKSNFVSFFRLLRELVERRLQVTIAIVEGGADACLYHGPKVTQFLTGRIAFRNHSYEFNLQPTPDNQFVFGDELGERASDSSITWFGTGYRESRLKECEEESREPDSLCRSLYRAISSFVVYHFHDTGPSAGMRRQHSLSDNETFRSDGSNLASFLYLIRQSDFQSYASIRDAIRVMAPFFDDFKLRPVPASPDRIQLEWSQKGSDFPFQVNQLSDGTLRFLCLATALLQPAKPQTMLFDEPELGLHPFALTLLGNLFRQATSKDACQVIISTQSAQLLNEFEPEDIIVVERKNGQSTFERMDPSRLSQWLDDYTLGELWQKNLLGGRPREEAELATAAGPRLQNI